MNSKRSQVTLILLFVAVALLVVGISLLSENSEKKFYPEQPDNPKNSMQLFVSSCLQETLKEGILRLGLQGGYNTAPEKILRLNNTFIPIYFQRNNSNVPSLTRIEEELSDYIEKNIHICLNGFQPFIDEGYEVGAALPDVQARISDNKISATMNYPITLQQQGMSVKANSFFQAVDFDFVEKYQTITEIIEMQFKNSNYIPISYLGSLASDKGFMFDVIDFNESTVIYALVYENEIDSKPFAYLFAHQYDRGKV